MSAATMPRGAILDERFEIEGPVATGGMARVYRAMDRHSRQPVAVKILTLKGRNARERFIHEAVTLAGIRHPGIVRHVAHGVTAAGAPYLAMEWLDGEDLFRYLHRMRRAAARRQARRDRDDRPEPVADPGAELPSQSDAPTVTLHAIPEVRSAAGPGHDHAGSPDPWVPVDAVLQLGRALAAAAAEFHRRGIVHRDIKPANVFLVDGAMDRIKLLDLGTIHDQLASERITEPGRLVGTPNYMAPEQAQRHGEISSTTDVWAIGCVLYECLGGRKAFPGSNLLEVLSGILLTDPEPLAGLCPAAPQPLIALIERTLSKSPADRPRDGAALARELDALAGSCERPAAPARSPAAPPAASAPPAPRTLAAPVLAPPALTATESRVTCMLFARRPRSRAAADPAAGDAFGPATDRTLRSVGAALQHLADGTLLVTIPAARAPTDQAARAARAALTLRASAPALAMVLATGRTEGPGQRPRAQAVRQATRALATVDPGQIRVDALTASLLDARFHIAHDPQGAAGGLLEAERPHEAARTLLGKPTPWVGRQRELSYLLATFEECVSERVARAVLVTAPAGMGKSRLRHELEQALRRRGDHLELVQGQGDAVSAGTPFTMIAPALRRLAGIRGGEPVAARRRKLCARLAETMAPADMERVAAFLGEMLGTPFPDHDNPALRAARQDPMYLGQRMQSAWEDWLRAECARRPVLLVLEDLHWGDLPSVQYVDRALRALQDAPFMVLALARPEVHGVFPQLWAQRAMQEMQLRALPRRACLALVRGVLGPEVAEAVAEAVIARAGGNAFYLEELIRAVAEGGPAFGSAHALPDTVLGMVQARLDALGDEAKRALRAASIFGEVFWEGGVAALLGQDDRPGNGLDLRACLDDLVAREIIERRPEARLPGGSEYGFRHALVRDGAYALLTEADRSLGHGLAGAWLERAGEPDGQILGEHYMRGGNPERAIPCFHRAAAQALEGNDLAAVISRAERAAAAGARGEVLGALRALQSVASYWQSDYAASRRHGSEAAALLPVGSSEWFQSVGSATVSSARLGDHERVDALMSAAVAARCAPGAEAAQIVCLARGTFQLVFYGRAGQADQVLARIEDLLAQAGALDELTMAQVNTLRCVHARYRGDLGTCFTFNEAAVAAFERAGDLRNAALERNATVLLWCELGSYEHAAALARRNLETCRQLGAQQAITFTTLTLGGALSRCAGREAEARQVLEETIRAAQEVGNTSVEGWARGHLTRLAHQAGDFEAEEREAARAVALLAASPGLRGGALAAHARALLALDRPAEALARAREAMQVIGSLGDYALLDGNLAPLMLALALDATGDREAARAAIARATAHLERLAASLPDPGWRARFWTVHENRLTRELSRAWDAS